MYLYHSVGINSILPDSSSEQSTVFFYNRRRWEREREKLFVYTKSQYKYGYESVLSWNTFHWTEYHRTKFKSGCMVNDKRIRFERDRKIRWRTIISRRRVLIQYIKSQDCIMSVASLKILIDEDSRYLFSFSEKLIICNRIWDFYGRWCIMIVGFSGVNLIGSKNYFYGILIRNPNQNSDI